MRDRNRGGVLLEGGVHELLRLQEARIQSAEENQRRDLQQTNLQGVRGTDLHGQRNIAVHGEGDGVLSYTLAGEDSRATWHRTYEEFRRVRHESEKRDTKEFLIDFHALQNDVYRIHENLRDDCIEQRGPE